MNATVQGIIGWARKYIPDEKTRIVTVRDLQIGMTSAPTGTRETFYIKHSPVGTVSLYVEPYTFSAVSSLKAAATNSNVFMWASSTLSCTFSDGESDPPRKPFKFVPVLANYEYESKEPYIYSDSELAETLPEAISYLNNTYGFSYSYSGTAPSIEVSYSNTDDKEIIAKGLSVIIRRQYVGEQKRKGLGVAIRGPMQSIDTKTQLNHYEKVTKELEEQIKQRALDKKVGDSSSGQVIDNYSEPVVDT